MPAGGAAPPWGNGVASPGASERLLPGVMPAPAGGPWRGYIFLGSGGGVDIPRCRARLLPGVRLAPVLRGTFAASSRRGSVLPHCPARLLPRGERMAPMFPGDLDAALSSSSLHLHHPHRLHSSTPPSTSASPHFSLTAWGFFSTRDAVALGRNHHLLPEARTTPPTGDARGRRVMPSHNHL